MPSVLLIAYPRMHPSAILILATTALALQPASSQESAERLWPLRGEKLESIRDKSPISDSRREPRSRRRHREPISFLRALLEELERNEKGECTNPEMQRIYGMSMAAKALGSTPNPDASKSFKKLIEDYYNVSGFTPILHAAVTTRPLRTLSGRSQFVQDTTTRYTYICPP